MMVPFYHALSVAASCIVIGYCIGTNKAIRSVVQSYEEHEQEQGKEMSPHDKAVISAGLEKRQYRHDAVPIIFLLILAIMFFIGGCVK